MKNSCKLTLITDSFRQFYQNQSVDGFDLLFEVHITFGLQSEVPHLFWKEKAYIMNPREDYLLSFHLFTFSYVLDYHE